MAAKKTIGKEALAVLASMDVEGNAARFDKYHQLGGVGQLDRKLYEECNKALEAIGGKWNRGKKAHLFTDDPRDALDQVVLTGAFTDAKQEFQAFYTPAALADRIVEKCGIREEHDVLEPEAGRGAIIDAVLRAVPKLQAFTLVEMMPVNAKALREKGYTVHEGNFIEWSTDMNVGAFDRIPMNPPFTRGQDIEHVTRAYSLLRGGGRLVSVMSASVKYRQDRKATAFRALVESHGGEIEDLPEDSFKSSGTSVRTVLVTIDKE